MKKNEENFFRSAGSGLLFHALRRNTIGAENFHVRVRNGIVCSLLALTTSMINIPCFAGPCQHPF